jgi:signal transduction histidine kinase
VSSARDSAKLLLSIVNDVLDNDRQVSLQVYAHATALECSYRSFCCDTYRSAPVKRCSSWHLLCRLRDGQLRLQCTSYNLQNEISHVVKLFGDMATAQLVTLDHSITDDTAQDMRIKGDTQRLKQIMMNLIHNAIRFTPADGHVTVDVSAITSGPDSTALLVRVTDTGIGIDPVVLRTLFEPYHKGDSTSTRKHGGAGLGENTE